MIVVMESNLLETRVDHIIHEAIDEADGTLLLVDPSPATVEAMVDVGVSLEEEGIALRVLATDSTLKEATDDFLTASHAADLVEDDTVTFRTLGSPADNSLLVWDETVLAIVSAGDQVAALSTMDPAFVGSVYETYAAEWEGASEFVLRTPPLSRVRETLADEIGTGTREDFDAVLQLLPETNPNDRLDEVTIALLVAAKNSVLLYDISKWGEDIGVASKATFSRTKSRLEEEEILTTEKVPIDVGRPRLRLRLTPDLANESLETIVEETRARLG